jgi:hypothetical protein
VTALDGTFLEIMCTIETIVNVSLYIERIALVKEQHDGA